MPIEPARTSLLLTDDEILASSIDEVVGYPNRGDVLTAGGAVISRLECEEEQDEDAPALLSEYDPGCQSCIDSATGYQELSLESLGRLACTCDPHPDADCNPACAVCMSA